MTIERAPRQAPRIGLTGLEWKLLLTAVLGASYTAAWLAIAGPAGAPPQAQPSAGPRRAKAATAVAGAPRPSKAGRIRTRSS
jgi:hypothetical protein